MGSRAGEYAEGDEDDCVSSSSMVESRETGHELTVVRIHE